MIRRGGTFALAVLLARPIPAAPPAIEAGAMERLIDQGLEAMYNLDHATAGDSFRELARLFPDHPIGPYGLTTALWWELTNEYDERDDRLEREFLDAADATVEMTRPLIRAGDPSGVARLCRGGALGLKGRWDALQGRWLAAYRNGKKAFDLQTDAIRVNPELYDAYLGPGIFHYYVAVLPAGVKSLARIVFGGSKEQGLNEIRLTMEKGRFARTAARLFLVNIFINNEKNPDEALALLRDGRREHPDSPFFDFVELLVLDEAGRWDDLGDGARFFLDKIERGLPHYRPTLRHRGLYALGNSHLGRGEAAAAAEYYDRVIDGSGRDDRWVSLALLNRGKAKDLLGRRADAEADYRETLRRRDVWELHDKAKALLRRPHAGDSANGRRK